MGGGDGMQLTSTPLQEVKDDSFGRFSIDTPVLCGLSTLLKSKFGVLLQLGLTGVEIYTS